MPDDAINEAGAAARPATGAARRALDYLGEMSPELRGAAILDGDGRLVAATAEAEEWQPAAAAMLAALDEAAASPPSPGQPLDSAQVATGDSEVFMVRESGLTLLAVTARFVLASLTAYDMRMVLRDLGREASLA